MFVTRWPDMRTELNRFQQEFNRLLNRFEASNGVRPVSYPALNVWTDEQALYLEAELPGMELEDLEILINDNQLTIKGERKRPPVENGVWHRQERGYGMFSRTLELPALVDADRVEAHLKNGVLTITLPKREESKPRKIIVKTE